MQSLYVTKILVQNFRNLPYQIFNFNNGINLIYGSNGVGKTNLLESIYYAIYSKSFRKNVSFPQLLNINCGKDELLFQLVFNYKNKELSYSKKMTSSESIVRKDDSFIEHLHYLFISPSDSHSFYFTAEFRRDLINRLISMVDKEYKKNISKYNKILISKKNYIIQNQFKEIDIYLDVIDKQIAEISLSIKSRRDSFLNQLNEYLSQFFKEIFSMDHEISIKKNSSFDSFNSIDSFSSELKKNRELDFKAKRQVKGIHNDDYQILFDHMNSGDFCSLGQQKICYLSMIFSYVMLYHSHFNCNPILLIDDISGELDALRWKQLVFFLIKRDFQVIMTTANPGFFDFIKTLTAVNYITLT